MATFVKSAGPSFAVGATIGAYLPSALSGDPPSGAAVGAATATGTVAADGTLTIQGLAANTRYYLGASDGSTKWVAVTTESDPPATSVASAAALAVPSTQNVVTVTGTTNITSIPATYAGHRVTLIFAGILTFTDGSNLKLAGNFVTTADDTITLVCDGTNWFETSRSVN